MLPVITIATQAAALYSVADQTGVIGFDAWLKSIVAIVPRMALKAHKADRGFVDEMVELAKGRVPVDTGRLLHGIEARDVGDHMVEFRAAAVHDDKPNSKEDYAHFVEFGMTRGSIGAPVVADATFFTNYRAVFGNARQAKRNRKSYRNSSGTAPQPFFYNSAADVLAKREMTMADVVVNSAEG